jgi:hypothetical protein
MTESVQVDDNAISGYLYKRTRDNRWQKRWFETNGVYLTYYKSKKADKLLAALSLPQVGEIKIVTADEDPDKLDGLFSLELNARIYVLRAKTNEEALVWVNMLAKLKSDGIQATMNPTTIGIPSSSASTVSDSASSNNNQDEKGRSEWIKSGKSCCGCC